LGSLLDELNWNNQTNFFGSHRQTFSFRTSLVSIVVTWRSFIGVVTFKYTFICWITKFNSEKLLIQNTGGSLTFASAEEKYRNLYNCM